MFVHENKLLRGKVVRGGFCVELLARRVRGMFIVLARYLSSKKQFSNDVVCRGFSIEFAAYVGCGQGGKLWLHAKRKEERGTFNGAMETGVVRKHQWSQVKFPVKR